MTTISLKIDENTKKEAQKIAEKMGLPLGTIIKIYLKQLIRTKQINITLPQGKEKWLTESKEALKGKIYKDENELINDCLN